MRRILASKTGMRGALPNGTHATSSRSGSEEPAVEDTHELSSEGASAGARRVEGEAALGLTHMGDIGSPLLVARSQQPVAPLKTSFVARSSGG